MAVAKAVDWDRMWAEQKVARWVDWTDEESVAKMAERWVARSVVETAPG